MVHRLWIHPLSRQVSSLTYPDSLQSLSSSNSNFQKRFQTLSFDFIEVVVKLVLRPFCSKSLSFYLLVMFGGVCELAWHSLASVLIFVPIFPVPFPWQAFEHSSHPPTLLTWYHPLLCFLDSSLLVGWC